MDSELFDREAFVKECVARGYVRGNKQFVRGWCKIHPKEFYTEDDMIAVYRYFEACKIGGREDAYKKSIERRPSEFNE